MATVICKHCGATGESKCPYCRNVFADDSIGIPSMAEIRQGKGEFGKLDGCDELHLVLPYSFSEGAEASPQDFKIKLLRFHEFFKTLTADQAWKMFCRHSWQFAPGQESSIGCGHKAST